MCCPAANIQLVVNVEVMSINGWNENFLLYFWFSSRELQFLLVARLQVCQLLSLWFSAHLECFDVSSKKCMGIYVFAIYLEGETECKLGYLTPGHH